MIRLRLEGRLLERLLRAALEQGATFRVVRRQSDRSLILETDERGAKIVLALCEKYGLFVQTLRVRGLPALRRAFLRRWTLLAGLAVCAALLIFYTQRIWLIEVRLADDARPVAVDEGEILEALAQLGAVPGTPAAALDTDLLALELAARYEALSFVGVRVRGVRLTVELAPALDAPELYDPDAARDLVAACDGVIVSVSARNGVAAVEPGDFVRRGEVLIRGEERSGADQIRPVAALGEVVARTWVSGEAEGSLFDTRRSYTGRESASVALCLFDLTWPLVQGESFSLFSAQVETLPVGGLFLPLHLVRTTAMEYTLQRVAVDQAQLQAALSEQAFADAEAKIALLDAQTLQIVDKWIDYSMIEDESMRARAIVEIHRDIAVTRDALAREG